MQPKQKTNVTTKTTTVPIAATKSDKATFSGRMAVMPDGSPDSTTGYLHYQSRQESGSYIGTVGEFQDRFRFDGPAGHSYLTYFADGFAPVWSEKFDVQPGDMVEGILLTLHAGTTAEIQVQSQDGSPIAGATVVRLPVIYGAAGGPIHPHETDKAGRLRLPNYADVPYVFRVEAAGYKKLRTDPIKIRPEKPIVLTLQR